MAKTRIDLDALERVVGCPPQRYPGPDARNVARARWWARATHALRLLSDRELASQQMRTALRTLAPRAQRRRPL
jgi:hypothetical protein